MTTHRFMRDVFLRIVCMLGVAMGTSGCLGTETGNPVAPTLDASRIMLVMHEDRYEVIGEPGAVSDDAEVASFEVWSEAAPLRLPANPVDGFSFEFVNALPPFRVFAENDGGQSTMVELGIETSIEIGVCFSYTGREYDFDVGTVVAQEGSTPILSFELENNCADPQLVPTTRMRLAGDGLAVLTPETPIESGGFATVSVVAGPSTTRFDNIILIGNRTVGSIALRGEVQR